MWPWIIAGIVVLWLMKSGTVSLSGQQSVPQLPGAAGIVQTLGLMRSMTNQAIDHPLIRQYAARATEHVGRGNAKESAVAIGEWVRAKVRYLPDPLHKENLTNPATMIQAIDAGKKVFGDCDDMSMLVAAMAKSIGMQPTFHGVGRGARFHHVYTEVAGLPIDPTVPLGTKPFRAQRRISVQV
jgi:transglutaminase-like putative cysteine protease